MADVYSSCGCGTNCGDAPDVRVVAGNDLTVEALVSIYDEDKGYYAAFDLSGASDVRMRIVGAYSKVEGENVTVSGSKAKALFKAGRYGAGDYGVEITFTRGQESFRVFERGLFSVVRDSGEASLGTSAEGGSGEGMNISVDVRSRTLRVGQVSGITDYNLLDNRPSIGGVTLEGDRRPSDLGMYSREEADAEFETKSHAADTFQTKESAAEADKRVQGMLDGKVDKIAGKGLSTNDFSNDDKIKLDSLQPGGVPEEVVRQAVNDYVAKNSGGFIAQPNGLNLVTSYVYKLMPSALGEPIALTTGWTGDLSNGFSHVSGNTDALEFSLSGYATGDKLLVTFDATGIYSDSEDVLISHGTSIGIKSYNGNTTFVAGFIHDGSNLFVTPTPKFSGTITRLKVRKIDEDNGTENVTVSEHNLYTYRGDLVAGYWNIAIGSRNKVFSKMQDGTRNIAIGKEALNSMVFGNRNVAIGTYSMPMVTEGENNIAIGSDSIYPVKKAINSISIGKGTMSGKSVENCVALGYGAMGLWDFECIRNGCTAIGALSATGVIKGNTHVGYRAGVNTKGAYNTSIGYNSLGIGTRSSIDIVGENLTCVGHDASVANNDTAKAANNSTALGYGATITKSNQVVIGNKQIEEVILGGKRLLFNNDNTLSWETIS